MMMIFYSPFGRTHQSGWRSWAGSLFMAPFWQSAIRLCSAQKERKEERGKVHNLQLTSQ
jgi:hypothetical protein